MAKKLSRDNLEQMAGLVNAVGVFEALRCLAQEGPSPEVGPVHCGKDFWIFPYTKHLHNKHAIVGPLPDLNELPCLLVPELVLLDILPDFFRTYCQPYRFADQIQTSRSKSSIKDKLTQRESKTEQIARDQFGRFVNQFLNAHLYQIGSKGWNDISQWLRPLSSQNRGTPLLQHVHPILALRDKLKLPEQAWKVACNIPITSMRGVDRGRFRWGFGALIRAIWPHEPFQLSFPGMAPAWGQIHPASQTRLGLQCGHLGSDFYLGTEVPQQSTTLLVELQTTSTKLFHALKPGPSYDAIKQIAETWLASRQLKLDFRIQFSGALSKLPWILGAKPAPTDTNQEPHDDGVESFGRLGYTTYLTSES